MVSWALKEWQAAVSALLQGETILLLRKGGIRETKGQFSVAAQQVLLLPTTEHQDVSLLKEKYRGLLAADSVPTAGQVRFTGWATITHTLPLTTREAVEALLPHLIWNQQFVAERMNWQPDRPLYALLLQAYRLEVPLLLSRHAGYGGCRSWVELGQTVAVEGHRPALVEADYRAHVDTILAALPSVTPIIL
ncbi:MAG: DUF1802 family protein [Cyanobacteria bacterium J06638_6]